MKNWTPFLIVGALLILAWQFGPRLLDLLAQRTQPSQDSLVTALLAANKAAADKAAADKKAADDKAAADAAAITP